MSATTSIFSTAKASLALFAIQSSWTNGPSQQPEVGPFVGDLVIDNQLMLRIHAQLDVVPHQRGFAATHRHRPAVRISQRDLRFAALLQLILDLPQLPPPLFHPLDLLPQLLGVGLLRQALLLFISLVQLFQILPDLLIQRLHLPLELGLGEVTPLPVDSLELAPVNGHQFASEQIELTAKECKL